MTYKMEWPGSSMEDKGSDLVFGISLLGKYPLDLGAVTFFPLLGIDYQLVLSAKMDGEEIKNEDDENMAGDLSKLWIKFGAGVDYPLTDALYLRGEILYGIGLASKFENDMVDGFGGDTKANLDHGPTIKIGLGYKF